MSKARKMEPKDIFSMIVIDGERMTEEKLREKINEQISRSDAAKKFYESKIWHKGTLP